MPLTLNDSYFLPFNLFPPGCLSPPRPHVSPSHLSFTLLLSPGGNYLHKSFFALWFAPFHKWRLSLFNRGGFASHVRAYNVAGPRFLHLRRPPPSSLPVLVRPGLLGGLRGTPRLRLSRPGLKPGRGRLRNVAPLWSHSMQKQEENSGLICDQYLIKSQEEIDRLWRASQDQAAELQHLRRELTATGDTNSPVVWEQSCHKRLF